MRFRVKKRINPYFVIGAGKLFTNLERSADLDAMHDRLKHQRIRSVTNESLNNLVPIGLLDLYANETRIPFIWKMRPSTSNATEWHLAAGIEYFFNERLSVAFEGRSMYTGANVDLEFDGEDQLNLMTWSEKILREDGSVRIFAPGPTAPNPFCYQVDWHGLGCNPQTHDYASRVDPEGLDVWGTQHYTCPAQGDFDMDGRPDVCYGRNVAPSPLGYTEPRGDIIVQGGKIRLPGVSAGVSLRFHF